jgi:hypothetical protein
VGADGLAGDRLVAHQVMAPGGADESQLALGADPAKYGFSEKAAADDRVAAISAQ